MPDKPPTKRKATPATRKGNGAGWGGAAKGKGESVAAVAPVFEAGNQAAVGYHDMSKSVRIAAHIARLERIADLAEAAGRFNEATAATVHVLNRLDGLPIARNINVNSDDLASLSDADIAAELASLGDSRVEAASGDAPKSLPKGIGTLVH